MVTKGLIKKGKYYDSVSLMIVAKEINKEDGVIDSAIVMGTNENKSILKSSKMLLDEFIDADDTDLLVAITAENESIIDDIFKKIDEHLAKIKKSDDDTNDFKPKSLENALEKLDGANLVLISVAGKYAAIEAKKALDKNLHVMLFSDNVSIEDEKMLKEYADEKDLLVMGPDCGTAIINGAPLAFANVVNRGEIGVVAASGTGLQEVTTIISNLGQGISQAIGTGGRDVKKEIGGIMFIKAIKALKEDENTKVLLLVSKPPHESVLKKIANEIKDINKPVVAVFLGAEKELVESYNMTYAETLEQGAKIAVDMCCKGEECISRVAEQMVDIDEQFEELAKNIAQKLNDSQKYIRGLYSGGTFCSEAQLIIGKKIDDIYSNAPTKKSQKLEDSNISVKHSIIDLGEDEFTVGKPHPMIDFSTRNERIIKEANDSETAVILLDLVLGYGSNMTPIEDIIPTLKQVNNIAEEQGRFIPVICSVTGTDKDPQNRASVIKALKEVGVYVLDSNAQASKLSLYIIENLNK